MSILMICETLFFSQVVLNAGLNSEISVQVTEQIEEPTLSYTVGGLTPYTSYSVRIGACLQAVVNSCSLGE